MGTIELCDRVNQGLCRTVLKETGNLKYLAVKFQYCDPQLHYCYKFAAFDCSFTVYFMNDQLLVRILFVIFII